MSLMATVMLFGDWLRAKREALGISQGQIAAELGVTRQAVSKWERNQSPPLLNPSQTQALCSILKVSGKELATAFEGQ